MEISERLEQELKEATARLRRLAQDLADEETAGRAAGSETVADVVDAAQGAADRDMHFVTRSLLQSRTRRLAAALARLNTGRYGTCDQCGEAIAPARLVAVPEVTSCVRCQDRRERAGHRRGAEERHRSQDRWHGGRRAFAVGSRPDAGSRPELSSARHDAAAPPPADWASWNA
jgi:DnaK suppressor protein